MTDDVLGDVRSVLSTTAQRWTALVNAVPQHLLTRAPAPGQWSAAECLAHLVETEKTVFPARLSQFMEGRGWLAAFDPDAQERKSPPGAPDELVTELAHHRDQNLTRLARVTADDLDRTAEHEELGRVTLRQLLCEWAAHDLAHTVQGERALMQPFIPASGPWRSYFSDHEVG